MLIVLKGKGIVGCYGNKRQCIRRQRRLVKRKGAHVEAHFGRAPGAQFNSAPLRQFDPLVQCRTLQRPTF